MPESPVAVPNDLIPNSNIQTAKSGRPTGKMYLPVSTDVSQEILQVASDLGLAPKAIRQIVMAKVDATLAGQVRELVLEHFRGLLSR